MKTGFETGEKALAWLFTPEFDDEPADEDDGEELLGLVNGLGLNDPDDWEDDAEYWEPPDWEDTPEQRDDRISSYSGECEHTRVRSRVRETGQAEEIQDELADIVTAEEDATAREGDVLDMRNVTRRLAGDTMVKDIYRRRQQRPGDDIAVGVSLDMSGSMTTDELDAKAAVGSFLHGVQQFGGDVVANAWHYTGRVKMITGPNEPFRWEHLDTVEPGGGTPTAIGVYEAGEMLRCLTADEHLLVVVTDGMPSSLSRPALNGETTDVLEEVRLTVAEIREHGIEVFGIGIGGAVNEGNLAAMFGDDAYVYTDLSRLAGELVDRYRDLINTNRVIP